VLPDGYGFLRSQAHNYLASPEDIYVSPSQIRRMGLRTGLVVEGPIRLPIEGQDNFALMQVELINSRPSDEKTGGTTFEDLTPTHPNRRLVLETSGDEMATRVIDLVTPIGMGTARPDRLPAAGRQDRPAPEDRPGAQEELPRRLPDRPTDRRAAGGGDRNGADDRRRQRRGRRQHLRRAAQRATSTSATSPSKRRSG